MENTFSNLVAHRRNPVKSETFARFQNDAATATSYRGFGMGKGYDDG